MIKKYSVSKQNHVYKAFPDLLLVDGKLICVFAEMDDDNKLYNIVYTVSKDKGVTWENEKIIASKIDDKGRWDCPRICMLKDNSIVVLATWYVDKDIDPDHHKSYVYMWKYDGEFNLIKGNIKTTITGIVPDKILELDDKLIISTHEKNGNKRDTLIYFSYDNGENWTEKRFLTSSLDYDLCETSIINVDDNLVALMRENSGQGIDCLKIISKDKGKTWSEIYKMPIPACHRPIITKLLSNNYLITYRFDQGKFNGRGVHGQNLLGCLCTKEDILEIDRNKISSRIFPIDYDRNINSNCGYTGVVQFEDGMIYVVSHIVDDNPVGQIRGYSFYEKDLLIK